MTIVGSSLMHSNQIRCQHSLSPPLRIWVHITLYSLESGCVHAPRDAKNSERLAGCMRSPIDIWSASRLNDSPSSYKR